MTTKATSDLVKHKIVGGYLNLDTIIDAATDVALFGAKGDGVTDDTAAIQLAINSGAKGLRYYGRTYLVNGTLEPVSNQTHFAEGAALVRTPGVGQLVSFFRKNEVYGSEGAGPTNVEWRGFRFIGTATPASYYPYAAAIRVVNASNIRVIDCYATGCASGFQAYYSEDINVANCNFSGNIVSGISGIFNNATIRNNTCVLNGYVGTTQTHDFYLLNSSRLEITGNIFGPHVEPLISTFIIRYGLPEEKPGYTEVRDISLHDNKFYAGDLRFNSDSAVASASRKPIYNVYSFNNTFHDGAAAWYDEASNIVSSGNSGMATLNVRVIGTFPGYIPDFVSNNDHCNKVVTAVIGAQGNAARETIIFEGTVINNGTDFAFNDQIGLGGVPSCTIKNPIIRGTGKPFDPGFTTRYQTNLGVEVMSTGDMGYFQRDSLVLATTNPFTPPNDIVGYMPFLVQLTGGLTVNAPVLGATGMRLELMIRNNGANNQVVTFNAAYKLTAATTAILNTNLTGQRLFLRFIYETGAWREVCAASWTAV